MLYGIDISNWQSGLQPSKIKKNSKGEKLDFVICKATEGTGFVDRYCDSFIQDCRKNKILFGFYHFAGHDDARKEAEFFYDNCKGYVGAGIPVLDYEVDNANNAQWCEKFLRRFHDLSGVWPILYISASRCSQYEGSWIPEKCGLWVAGYPYTMASWTYDEMPYDVSPWENAAIWQFTSQLILQGYVGKLDGDVAYMSREAWSKYAKSPSSAKPAAKPEKTLDDLVLETILGEYGTGKTRKKLLGDKYNDVQKRVNELYDIADEVIDGKWGNGWNREQALSGAGYPYNTVQLIVNSKLKAGK